MTLLKSLLKFFAVVLVLGFYMEWNEAVNGVVLYQPDTTVVPAQAVVETSPWTPALITALLTGLFAGFALIIGALGKVLVDLKQAKGKAAEAVVVAAEVKRTVEVSRKAGEEAGRTRDGKLDEIKMLVDGKFSQVLDRVAKLTRSIADRTGNEGDIADADEAEVQAEKQRDKVLAASLGAGIDVDGTLTVTDGKASLEVKDPESK